MYRLLIKIFKQNLDKYIFLARDRLKRTETGLNINRRNANEDLSTSKSLKFNKKICRL